MTSSNKLNCLDDFVFHHFALLDTSTQTLVKDPSVLSSIMTPKLVMIETLPHETLPFKLNIKTFNYILCSKVEYVASIKKVYTGNVEINNFLDQVFCPNITLEQAKELQIYENS